MSAFHEVRFPTDISYGSPGGPRRNTIIVTSGSGYENRNSQWADSRREYNAGYGVKRIDDIHAIIAFFEERRGRLHGFRWRDKFDFKSCPPTQTPSHTDQPLGTGDGAQTEFQLTKTYGSLYNPYTRDIKKPVAGTVIIGVGGALDAGAAIEPTTGVVTFASAPGVGAVLTAGYEFDVPVRFDTDFFEMDELADEIATVPSIPIVEIRL